MRLIFNILFDSANGLGSIAGFIVLLVIGMVMVSYLQPVAVLWLDLVQFIRANLMSLISTSANIFFPLAVGGAFVMGGLIFGAIVYMIGR